MKKTAGIITIYGNGNYGNKLQNYAVQEILGKYDIKATTIKNTRAYNLKKLFLLRILKDKIKSCIDQYVFRKKIYQHEIYDNKERLDNFIRFNELINTSNSFFSFINAWKYRKFDIYVVGSDQIWNPYFGYLNEFELAEFVSKEKTKISFSASFGVDDIPEELKAKTSKALADFKEISVREDAGKRIIENITDRKDCVVLLDPTMLLSSEEWQKVIKMPQKIEKLCSNGERFILSYFLGSLNENRKNEIERIAKENNCKIINILDKDDPFYVCGPSEFLWLEKNAFMVCTDSFHSSVFAILFKTPFVVFSREEKGTSMSSRLDTLLSKYKLEDRYYNDKITDNMLKCDFNHVDEILEVERKKADDFLKNALDMEGK